MQVTVNGKAQQVDAGRTVAELVADLGLAGRAVAVEVNRQIVPRRNHEDHALSEGDEIEIVTLVGGG